MSDMLYNFLMVAAGSGVGGALRYGVGLLVPAASFGGRFPLSTFLVNVVGCLVIGLIYGLIDRGVELSGAVRLFLTVGLCGGFTTFSTFARENYALLSPDSHWAIAAVYVVVSVVAGVLMVMCGYRLANIC